MLWVAKYRDSFISEEMKVWRKGGKAERAERLKGGTAERRNGRTAEGRNGGRVERQNV